MPFATSEKRANWSRDYYSREKDRVLRIKKSWVDRNPEKRRAHVAVGNAIRSGLLVKGECDLGPDGCSERIEAHHDDYSKPLEVRWICSTHHGYMRRGF